MGVLIVFIHRTTYTVTSLNITQDKRRKDNTDFDSFSDFCLIIFKDINFLRLYFIFGLTLFQLPFRNCYIFKILMKILYLLVLYFFPKFSVIQPNVFKFSASFHFVR